MPVRMGRGLGKGNGTMIEVACTRIIESANTIMDYDLRNGLDNKIDGICPVIKEDVVAKVFAKYALRLDITMSSGQVDRDMRYPYIKATSWVRKLDEEHALDYLLGLGCSTLQEASSGLENFWAKYALSHGDHQVFKADIPLRQCVPIYVHGDEGTTFKKDGALVLSFCCPIGKGVACQKDGDVIDQSRLRMNFKGHCFKTRFVMGTLFKDDHEDYPSAVQQLLELILDDVNTASREGVLMRSGIRLHLIPLGNKGDWSYLALCQGGNIEATFAGHLPPMLGRSACPAYKRTMDQELPWNQEPLFITKLMHQVTRKAAFFKIDAFHTINLGVAKVFGASSLVYLSALCHGSSIEDRLADLTAYYLEYCKANGKTNYVNKIDKALLGWKTSAPDGSWNKGALSTSLCLFIEHFTKVRSLEGSEDEMLSLIASCSRALNFWMQSLYHSDIFIAKADAMKINAAGRHFLAGFARLSLLSFLRGNTRFTYIPKVHMFWHLVDYMCDQASQHDWVMNPLAESCSVDEDLIGRFCILTRRVSPRLRGRRALERYLSQTLLVWQRPTKA
ncbi:unnamed protein product [Symbiodinium natans]|uniref:Uncharacterized protein n=1 Tax=Symbiodinium natans TaxID=878477 RepID=A0A812MWM6_9DINO|nr:unnamed protein product [Symbiodinium natans]